MEKKKIGISVGDINGVGLEVILKTIDEYLPAFNRNFGCICVNTFTFA